MSKFHESVRELLEDIYQFLCVTLHHELLSSNALTSKENLLLRLQKLGQLYPQLQLSFLLEEQQSLPSPVSPTPYLDMQGHTKGSFEQSRFEDSYELCSGDKSPENQQLVGSDDSHAVEASKYAFLPAADNQAFDKYGFLEKKGKERLRGLISPSQRRWYCIKDGLMYYYEKPSDQMQKGTIPLTGYEARPVQMKDSNKKKNNFYFELVCPGKHTYQFAAMSEKDLKQWVAAIEKNSKGKGKSPGTHHSQSGNENVDSVAYDDSCNVDDIYEMVDEEVEEDGQSSVQQKDFSPVASRGTVDETENRNGICDGNNSRFNGSNVPRAFDYQNLYVGLWDCTAEDEGELDFQYGDVIRIVSKEYDSYAWWVGELNGKIGFVPKSYLMEAYSKC